MSPSSSKTILISLSKEVHEISYSSKDRGTSNSLRISNLLVSENSENKGIVNRKNIVSKLFISKNIKYKSISNYKLVVQVSTIINHYLRPILVDSQLTKISDNLSTIYSKRRSLD